ncbi:ABC transporter permease [Brevibacterium casei]|uniref:ABC transporter permease n=1 Tax=Brevibacterium casei TaxID=33889 RepID=UPI00223AEB73|nr:ABC transporter permease [Brevibacterium casei]MCT1550171.1 ABC transporter permease [Brevibacterium casei]MCT1560121.1 ABC transporter permease [Brevibacterium casei]MCT2208275.1 ABC transporter permease [Brevibacterium casei]
MSTHTREGSTRLLATDAPPTGSRSADGRSAGDRSAGRGAHRDHPAHRAESGSNLTGLGTLLRFMLRRDRWRLPLWVLGLSAMTAYFANAIALVLDGSSLESMMVFAKNPVMGVITGPGYGFDDITVPRFIVGMYGVFLMLGAALMGILTISRHTRSEEQTGRAELIRANVTGRHTQLIAALVLAVLMSVLTSLGMAAAFYFSQAEPRPFSSVLLFGVSVGSVGVVFAGVAAVTAQLSAFSRACSGIAGAVLAAFFIVRGLGDMSAVQGGDLDWLSWLSPLGWAQQTAPFTLDRWWPLLLSVGFFVLLVVLALVLQSRRDLAAGILPDRLGRPGASAALSTPFALALRLQRSSLIWWSIGILVMGVVFGSFTSAMSEGADGMPPEILAIMGGAQGIVDGYLGYMALYFTIIVAVFGILSAAGLRGEEQAYRTEPVLATAVSRPGWLLSWAGVTMLGSLLLMALAGLGEGVGAAGSTGDWDLLWPTFVGHVAQTPAVWALAGLVFALYGWVPRLQAFAWIVFALGAVLALFGAMLKLDEAVLDLSVFVHIGQYPAVDLEPAGMLWLTVGAVVLTLLGAVGFRRRNLITA